MRPRTLGELGARSLRLVTDRAGTFAMVLAAVALPLIAVQAIAAPRVERLIASWNAVPRAHPADVAAFLAPALVGLALWALARTALFRLAAGGDAGADTRAVLGEGVARWPAQAGFVVAIAGVASVAAFGGIVVAALAGIVIGVLLAFTHALQPLLLAALALGTLAGAAAWAAVALLYDLGSTAVALEAATPLRALRAAGARLTDRRLVRRSALVGAAFVAYEIAAIAFTLPLAVAIGALTQSRFAVSTATTLLVVALEGLRLVFVAEYATDVRVRREGHDLVVDAAAPPDPFGAVDADGLDPHERSLVERYVARRGDLDTASRDAVARAIAQRIRPRLRATFAHLDDDALLVHLGRAAV